MKCFSVLLQTFPEAHKREREVKFVFLAQPKPDIDCDQKKKCLCYTQRESMKIERE
jgi:hypothetical protein